MLLVGNAVFLLIPSPSKKRVLHPGIVIESDSTSFVGQFEDAITPPLESDVNAFCEVNGKFFQQGAAISELRPGNVIAFRRMGEVVSAESRQTYRVSVASSDFVARIGKRSPCALIDISPEGFAAIVSDRLNLGSVVQVKLEAEGQTLDTPARVQTLKELPSGEFRYGFLVPQKNIAARKALQIISAQMQRLQLKRLRGAA